MEKHYLPINGKDINIDIDVVEFLFGVCGTISASHDRDTMKYAFYNTGHLCEVSYQTGSYFLKVKCFCDSSRCNDILHWLKTYLTNGMEYNGFGVDFWEFNGYFLAKFYEKYDV